MRDLYENNLIRANQKAFYEDFHKFRKINKIEKLKQDSRIRSIQSLINYSGKLKNMRVLIVGCGSGQDFTIIDRNLIAFDLSFNALKLARQNFSNNKYLVADAEFSPFIDNCFDLVICSEVLEHLYNPKSVILELYRILSKDGILIITVPNWLSFFGIARKVLEFVKRCPVTADNQPIDNWYTFKKLKNQLNMFEIEQVRGVWYFPPLSWRNSVVVPSSLAYIIFKMFLSLDSWMGKKFPIFGHILAVRFKK